jgi:GNAT superfamily N-acetyltransferase
MFQEYLFESFIFEPLRHCYAMKKYQLKLLDLEGVRQLVSWAADEGWNPGPEDAEVFYRTDPEGFYGFFEDGKLIAGGAIVSYDTSFGFMGLFIVQPGLRSKGLGKQLWYQRRNLLLSRLRPGAAIGMDGVVAMQPFYNRGGFEMAFRSERYRRLGSYFESEVNVNSIDINDFQKIIEYDTRCFGFPRPEFLEQWLVLQSSFKYAYTEEGTTRGYAVLRKVIDGYKIGPLFADNALIAEALYRTCLSSVEGEAVFLDAPVVNVPAIEMLNKYKATYVFECARMYYGNPPNLPMNNIFGITTFELG